MYYNVCKGIAIEYFYDEVLEKFSTYFCEYSNLIDHVITILKIVINEVEIALTW